MLYSRTFTDYPLPTSTSTRFLLNSPWISRLLLLVFKWILAILKKICLRSSLKMAQISITVKLGKLKGNCCFIWWDGRVSTLQSAGSFESNIWATINDMNPMQYANETHLQAWCPAFNYFEKRKKSCPSVEVVIMSAGEWINLKGSSEVIKINHNFLHLLNLENPTENFWKSSQFILMWGKPEFSLEV